MFKATVGLLLGAALLGSTALAQTASTSYVPATALAAEPGKIVVISHRGEHLHHPENTMPAAAIWSV